MKEYGMIQKQLDKIIDAGKPKVKMIDLLRKVGNESKKQALKNSLAMNDNEK